MMKNILLTQEQYNALKKRVTGVVSGPAADVLIPDLEANYITNRELLLILKISRRTAARWRATGHLPYIKIEHMLYYPTASILNSFGMVPRELKPCGHSPPVDVDPEEEIPVMQCEKCPLYLLMVS